MGCLTALLTLLFITAWTPQLTQDRSSTDCQSSIFLKVTKSCKRLPCWFVGGLSLSGHIFSRLLEKDALKGSTFSLATARTIWPERTGPTDSRGEVRAHRASGPESARRQPFLFISCPLCGLGCSLLTRSLFWGHLGHGYRSSPPPRSNLERRMTIFVGSLMGGYLGHGHRHFLPQFLKNSVLQGTAKFWDGRRAYSGASFKKNIM